MCNFGMQQNFERISQNLPTKKNYTTEIENQSFNLTHNFYWLKSFFFSKWNL